MWPHPLSGVPSLTRPDGRSEQKAPSQSPGAGHRLAAIVDSSDDAIISKSLDGTILTWNRAAERLFGYSAGEVIGRSIKMLIPPALHAEEDAILARIRAGQRVEHYDTRRERKDGGVIEISLAVSPIVDGSRRIVGVSTIARDVTERNRAQRELERLKGELEARVRERTNDLQAVVRDLEAFNYTVSHDLRTPLRAISGFAKLLLASLPKGEERRYAQYMLEGATEMSRIVDGLLRLSRINAKALAREPVDITALAQTILQRLEREHPERRVAATVQPGLVAHADPALVEVTMENLLANAWKFTAGRNPGSIHVGRRIHEGRSAFFVEDDGIGFSATDAERLFQPFQRLRPEEFEGNGIGLATVRRIVHAHGGGIAAEGEPGRRATLYFWL